MAASRDSKDTLIVTANSLIFSRHILPRNPGLDDVWYTFSRTSEVKPENHGAWNDIEAFFQEYLKGEHERKGKHNLTPSLEQMQIWTKALNLDSHDVRCWLRDRNIFHIAEEAEKAIKMNESADECAPTQEIETNIYDVSLNRIVKKLHYKRRKTTVPTHSKYLATLSFELNEENKDAKCPVKDFDNIGLLIDGHSNRFWALQVPSNLVKYECTGILLDACPNTSSTYGQFIRLYKNRLPAEDCMLHITFGNRGNFLGQYPDEATGKFDKILASLSCSDESRTKEDGEEESGTAFTVSYFKPTGPNDLKCWKLFLLPLSDTD